MVSAQPPSPGAAPARARHYLDEVLIVCLGLAVTVLTFFYARGVEANLADLLFERECQYRLESLRHTIETHLHALHALSGMYASGEEVEGEQFAGFARQMLPLKRGLQALEWIPRVSLASRAAFEAQGRRRHGPGFAIIEQDQDGALKPAAERPEYFPVQLTEPLEGNRRALGFDLSSNPDRREALERARDEGRLAVSGPVLLVQDLTRENGQVSGLLAFVPVYWPGVALDDAERRRQALRGFCLAVFRYDDMVASAMNSPLPGGMEMFIADQAAPEGRRAVYSHRQPGGGAVEPAPGAQEQDASPGLRYAEDLPLGGRVLRVTFVRLPSHLAAQRTWRPWTLALGCLTVTLVLATGFGRIRRDMEQIGRASEQLASELDLRQRAEAEIMNLARFTSEDPDPVLRLDRLGVILYANPAAGELLTFWQTGVGQTLPAEWAETVILTIESGLPREAELTRGDQVYSLLLVPFVQSGYLNLYGRNISARKRAEQALKDSEERYRNLWEAIPLGLVIVDAGRRITHLNQPMFSMLGYRALEMKGRDLVEFVAPSDAKLFLDQWQRGRQGELAPYEMTLAKKDGSSVFVHFFPRPLIAADGRFQGAFALVTDVTQRKILESQLLQAQKLESIGQLAAGIAHEINTPTQYVTDNTRFLEQSLQELLRLLGLQERLARQAEEQGLFAGLVADIKRVGIEIGLEYLKSELPISIEQTLEGLERIAKIVRSMKEFAHPGPDVKTPADLNKAIANTVTVARNEWKYVAEVVTDLDPELPPVPCVVGEINQVVLNVIVNAAHAIADTIAPGQERKGTIRISTRRDGDFVEIRVADDGPGIPPAIRNRVFDPFFTTKQPGKGTGQGLAIAHTVVVDKHKGAISFDTVEGGGATFVIRLPLKPEGMERA